MGILAVRVQSVPPSFAEVLIQSQPYRSRTLGTQFLQSILATASKTKIDKIYLHVQVSNQDAKRFYERHGFQQVQIQEGYYKKIEPRDAWVLEKSFS
jgi:ribosomal protein S18 acetylase RimI-like enzyme